MMVRPEMLENTSKHEDSKTYTLKEFANLTGKSQALIYRRLSEQPTRFIIRFARKEGDRWVFDRKSVDNVIAAGESLIIPKNRAVDRDAALKYISNRFRSCGKGSYE
jgi:predicted DNA-binding transcriptional regulator AlpA